MVTDLFLIICALVTATRAAPSPSADVGLTSVTSSMAPVDYHLNHTSHRLTTEATNTSPSNQAADHSVPHIEAAMMSQTLTMTSHTDGATTPHPEPAGTQNFTTTLTARQTTVPPEQKASMMSHLATTRTPTVAMTTHASHTNMTTTADKFRSVCFDGIGCFNNSYPFNNDGLTLPQDQSHVGTQFRLFTRNHTPATQFKVLTYNISDNSIRDSHFNPLVKTRVIVHGFSNDIDEMWMHAIKDAFQKIEDSNVILVGWGPGANSGYGQAVANSRLVATQLRLVLERLAREALLKLKDVHLIGHSLGAHASGDTGRQLAGRVGRITAMDPAGPNFEGWNNYVIVDKSDAIFVDTIHTNAKPLISGGAGMSTASGHVDFYVNGGRTQPGCTDGLAALFSGASVSCSHGRSHEVFLESITTECSFTAYPCYNQTYFQLGQCLDCDPGGCSELGLYADQHAARGPRYLNTQGTSPYCGFHCGVTIRAGAGQNTKGSILISLNGTWGSTDMMTVTVAEDQAITANADLVGVVVSSVEVGTVQSVTVRYTKYPGALGFSWFGGGSDTFRADSVQVLSGESGRTVRVCIPEHQRLLTHSHDVTIPVSTPGTC